MKSEEESGALDLDLGALVFFFSGWEMEHAGSPESFGGVGIKSKRKTRSKAELNLPISRPTCSEVS